MKITHLLVFHEEELFTENSQREFLSIAGWSSPVARQAHNLKVVGSNPTPATKIFIIKINNLQDKAVSKKAALFAFFNRFLTSSFSVILTKKVNGHFFVALLELIAAFFIASYETSDNLEMQFMPSINAVP
jgi:hypothetical protein